MSKGTNIGDLYMAVSIPVNKASWSKMEKQVMQYQRRLQSHMDNLAMPNMQIASFGDAARKSFRGIGAAALSVGKMGFLAAGAAAVVATKDAFDFDAALTDLSVSSGGAIGDLDKLRTKILHISDVSGVTKEQVLAGAAAYVKLTGDTKTASQSMAAFAKIAFGQGATMDDVAGTAATLGEQFSITGKDFERAFSILSAGGKAGKVELREMAALTASLGANFKPFGGSQGIGGLATLGASFQIAARNFGSASEAATGLESLMGSLQANASKLRKDGGVKVFEADGKTLKPMLEIVDALTAKNFNGEKIFDLLGRKEAVKAFNALRNNRLELEKIRNATLKADDVQTDFARRSASASAKAGKSWNKFKNDISRKFDTGALKKIADGLAWVFETVEANIQFITLLAESLVDALEMILSLAKKAGNFVVDAVSHIPAGALGAAFSGGAAEDAISAVIAQESARKAALSGTAPAGAGAGPGAPGAPGTVINQFTVTGTTDPRKLAQEIDRRIKTSWVTQLTDLALSGGS